MKKYQVIYADPPWDMGKFGLGKDMRTPKGYEVNVSGGCKCLTDFGGKK